VRNAQVNRPTGIANKLKHWTIAFAKHVEIVSQFPGAPLGYLFCIFVKQYLL
jgi:hypothetical protein